MVDVIQEDGELLFELVSNHFLTMGEFRFPNRYYLRKIQTPDAEDNKTYHCFAVIQAIDGIKYTIGRRYSSRSEQGEFILLTTFQANKLDITGSSFCEIIYRNNKFWVTPVLEKFNGAPFRAGKIYINEQQVFSTRILGFGDHLTFREHIGARHIESVRFLFGRRQLGVATLFNCIIVGGLTMFEAQPEKSQNSITSCDVSAVALPQLNAYVLSHIMSYLSISDLKTMRLVSKTWDEESSKYIKQRCSITLDFRKLHEGKNPNEGMKIHRYLTEMKEYAIQNWTILFPLRCPPNLAGASANVRCWDKVMDDITYLLTTSQQQKNEERLVERSSSVSPSSHNILAIRKLQIFSDQMDNESEHNLMIRLLEGFQATLQQLALVGYPRDANNNNNNINYNINEIQKTFQFPTTITFPQLEGFAISRHFFSATWTGEWLKALMQAVSGVKAFHVRHFARNASCISLKVFGYINQFHNLQELKIDETYPTAQILSVLIQNLRNKLRKLELGFIDIKLENVNLFENFLCIHSSTLQSLQFIIGGGTGCSDAPRLAINLPSFPNLRTLKIGYAFTHVQRTDAIILNFGDEDISYDEHLPVLQQLELDSIHNVTNPSATTLLRIFFGSFFPFLLKEEQEPQRCKSVLKLNLPYQLLPRIFPTVGRRGGQVVSLLADRFPNAHNPTLNKIRNNMVD